MARATNKYMMFRVVLLLKTLYL